jgi:hypothetical protein
MDKMTINVTKRKVRLPVYGDGLAYGECNQPPLLLRSKYDIFFTEISEKNVKLSGEIGFLAHS